MKELLNRISDEGLILEVKEGKLQIFATKDEVDDQLVLEIKAQKEALLSYLIQHKKLSLQNVKYQEIPSCSPNTSYPVSNAQLRLWLACQTEEGSIAHNMPSAIILDGTYDIACFEKAIHAVIQRHEILRTIFKLDEHGALRQYVLSAADLNFKLDLQNFVGRKDIESAWKEYTALDAFRAFDLENGPLLRAGLIQLADEQYLFYYNLHHIISDEWSMDILSRDVMNAYEHHHSGTSSILSPLRIQYKDYSAWQLSQLDSPIFKGHKEYWLSQLVGEIPTIDLPTQKRRPKIRTFNGRSIAARLSPDLTSRLRNFTREKGGSLFTGLLTAWYVLLYRYTGETNICIGNPVAGRDHPDLENQIGFYLHTLALVNQINPEDSFIVLYEQIKTSVLQAYQHKMYPFDKLVEELNFRRDASRNPLFDILVDYHGVAEKETSVEHSEALELQENGMVKFDLELHLTECGAGVDIGVNYNRDVYEQAMIERLILHYRQLLKALLAAPEKPICAASYLLEEEQNKLLTSFNATQVDFPKDQTVVDLFVKQSQETPDATAVVFGKERLSYQELELKSSQLANCLKQEKNVKPGDFVGIHLERSEQYIIAIFAIFKAGAVYVPIDINYPSDRKKYILEDASVRLLITDSNYMFDTEYYQGTLLAIDIEFEASNYHSVNERSVSPMDVAYVIYTSGSTGKPKGVMIEHYALMNYITWGKDYYLNNDLINQSFGLYTSLSFDLTITSLFLPLISGATLHVFKEEKDTLALLKEYLSTALSCIKITPSHISLLGDTEMEYSNLELAIVGGEELKKTHLEILRRINPNIKIYNEYGPTEATVGCVVYEVKDPAGGIYIGKPIQNTSIYILDSSGQFVPFGVSGEVHIGGAGLAKAYLNKAELTKEKFIAHPFQQGERLYKTGDLACWLPDGNIVFKGRVDQQVKIRGYRIELEEIAAVLNQLAGIEESVVIDKEDNNGFKQLVAYLVGKEDLDTAMISQALAKKLPDYMVPKIYVTLAEMPLTHNGKINRKALPRPNEEAYLRQVYVAPSSDTEMGLVNIWQQVLGIEKIGVKDSFFDLGGHSLIAVKLSFEITKVYKVKLGIEAIFKYPTVQLQAQYIDIVNTSKEEQTSQNEEIMYL
ncbi:MAG: amino acid adenylation domain-containing protein [Saprospiraceae bacterium]